MRTTKTLILFGMVATLMISCSKKELLTKTPPGEGAITTQGDNFTNWALARNGRWLPFLIQRIMEDKQIPQDSILTRLNRELKIINNAKAYYRNKLKWQYALNDSMLTVHLDSLYQNEYDNINESLKLQSTMDSLYAHYKLLPSVSYNFTRRSFPGNAAARNSENPDAPVYTSSTCIPEDITGWINDNFNNAYNKLQQAYLDYNNTWGGYGPMMGTLNDAVNGAFYAPGCIRDLLVTMFRLTIPRYYDYDDVGEDAIQQGPYTCQDAVDSLVLGIRDYYACINQPVPSNVLEILAPGDPFAGDYAGVYTSNYSLSFEDMNILNAIHEEDAAADNFVATYLSQFCTGMPNMGGNIYFQGNKEHFLIQLHYMSVYGGEREYVVPYSSSNNPYNAGRVDIANRVTGEMFEIKSSAEDQINKGKAEITVYVTNAELYCKSSLALPELHWTKGLLFAPVTLPYSTTENLTAEWEAPGLITYDRIPKNTQPNPITVPESTAIKLKRLIERLRGNLGNSGMTEKIIVEFLRDPANANVLLQIKSFAYGASVAIIVGTILEDFATLGAGILDDIPCFVTAYKIVRIARAI